MQLVQLQQEWKKIRGAGAQLVAISYDSTGTLQSFAEQKKITFRLLSDKDSRVIDSFGVRNKRAKGRQDGIPHPITFVVDRNAVIRAKLPGTILKRHTTEALLKALRAIQP